MLLRLEESNATVCLEESNATVHLEGSNVTVHLEGSNVTVCSIFSHAMFTFWCELPASTSPYILSSIHLTHSLTNLPVKKYNNNRLLL